MSLQVEWLAEWCLRAKSCVICRLFARSGDLITNVRSLFCRSEEQVNEWEMSLFVMSWNKVISCGHIGRH